MTKELYNLFMQVVNGAKVTDDILEKALYEICNNEHATCSNECPVYRKMGGVVGGDKPFHINRGCDCFKSGKNMLIFLRNKL